MELKRHEVPRRGGDMDGSHTGDGGFGHVNIHLNAVILGHIADLLRLHDAASRKKIGMNDRESMRLQERLEIFLKIDIFARAERCRRGGMKLLPLLGIAPRQNILRPGKMVFLKAAQKLNGILIRNMAEVVDGDRNFPADHIAHVSHILLKIIKPLFRNMNTRMAVSRRKKFKGFAAHHAGIDRTVRSLDNILHLTHILKITERRDKRVLDVHQKFNAKIHLEERKAHFHALFKRQTHIAPAALGVGIAIAADLIAPLPAEKLPDGNTPRLAANIPARQLNRANAASLARIAAELLDTAENLLYITRIFAKNTAFEHRRVRAARSVTHFTVADDSLIRVKL